MREPYAHIKTVVEHCRAKEQEMSIQIGKLQVRIEEVLLMRMGLESAIDAQIKADKENLSPEES